jgi:hypothetical protein
MFGIDDVIAGVIVSSLVEIGKKYLSGALTPNQEVSKEIGKAFDKALYKWEKHNQKLKDQKAGRITDYREKFENCILQLETIDDLPLETRAILNFFQEEILINIVANNYFQNLQLKEHTKILNSISVSVKKGNNYTQEIHDNVIKHHQQIEVLLNNLGKEVDVEIQKNLTSCIDLFKELNFKIDQLPGKEYHDKNYNDICKRLDVLSNTNLDELNSSKNILTSKIIGQNSKEIKCDIANDFFISNIESNDFFHIQRNLECSSSNIGVKNVNSKNTIKELLNLDNASSETLNSNRIVILGTPGTGKTNELINAAHLISKKKNYYPTQVSHSIKTRLFDTDRNENVAYKPC